MDEASAKRLAEIVHDFTTPLAAIRSSTETMEAALSKLETAGLEPEALAILGDSIRVNRAACERLLSLVKGARRSERFEVQDCIEKTLLLTSSALGGRIKVFKDYGATPKVDGDSNQVGQIVMNILLNAAQAIDGTGEIRIKTWEEQGSVRIAISDTGRGIAPENQPRIFDRGFSTKPPDQGSGLGLSICRKILEEHNGKIELETEIGRGSTFTIILPVK